MKKIRQSSFKRNPTVPFPEKHMHDWVRLRNRMHNAILGNHQMLYSRYPSENALTMGLNSGPSEFFSGKASFM